MKTITILFITFILCTSCGVKDEPEYKSNNIYNNKIIVI
ncbi:MAG: hypothetical protein FD546_000016 [Pelagibacterales bacterium]|nr:hypothetical protein [Pelagibacterales bacterium]